MLKPYNSCSLVREAPQYHGRPERESAPAVTRGDAGELSHPPQPVADRVHVAHKHLTRTARRRIIVMPTKTEYAEGTPNWVDVQTTDQ